MEDSAEVQRMAARYAHLATKVEQQLRELSVPRTVAASSAESYAEVGLDHLSARDKRRLNTLLLLEHRAWVAAHGSAQLQSTLGHAYAEGKPFVEEWLLKTFPEQQRQAHARGSALEHGVLYEQRLPGSHLTTRMVVVQAQGRTRALALDAFAGETPDAHARTRPLMQWLADRAESVAVERGRALSNAGREPERSILGRATAFLGMSKANTNTPNTDHEPRVRPDLFLGVDKNTARFLVDVDGRKRLVSFELADGAESWDRATISELNAFAVPAHQAREVMARHALVERLETDYQLPVRPVRNVAEGRVDKILTNPQGTKRAVVVTDRAVHVVTLGAHATQARELLGQQVQLSRTAPGGALTIRQMEMVRGRSLRLADQVRAWGSRER